MHSRRSGWLHQQAPCILAVQWVAVWAKAVLVLQSSSLGVAIATEATCMCGEESGLLCFMLPWRCQHAILLQEGGGHL